MEKIKDFILDYLQQEYTIDESVDVMNLNFVESGYVDSMGLIRFVVSLEDEFGIEFSEDEISSDEFRVVGSLAKLIESKL